MNTGPKLNMPNAFNCLPGHFDMNEVVLIQRIPSRLIFQLNDWKIFTKELVFLYSCSL